MTGSFSSDWKKYWKKKVNSNPHEFINSIYFKIMKSLHLRDRKKGEALRVLTLLLRFRIPRSPPPPPGASFESEVQGDRIMGVRLTQRATDFSFIISPGDNFVLPLT